MLPLSQTGARLRQEAHFRRCARLIRPIAVHYSSFRRGRVRVIAVRAVPRNVMSAYLLLTRQALTAALFAELPVALTGRRFL